MWQISESKAEGKLIAAHSNLCTRLWEDIDVPWGKEIMWRRKNIGKGVRQEGWDTGIRDYSFVQISLKRFSELLRSLQFPWAGGLQAFISHGQAYLQDFL